MARLIPVRFTMLALAERTDHSRHATACAVRSQQKLALGHNV